LCFHEVCDVDYYEWFEELQVLTIVILSGISGIKDMVQFIVQGKLSEMYSCVLIVTSCYYCIH